MFYEETIIGGILHYRTSATGVWQEFSKEQLMIRIQALTNQLKTKTS